MAKKNRLLELVFPFLEPIAKAKDLTIVMMIVAIIAIIIVPLPSAFLDLFLTISLSLSVLIILISIYVPKPTDLTTFPTLLLIITLFRLSLNIATTRMILTNGHLGVNEVSDIISSFGNFVVGGNFVIGIVVFTILVLINFMVITKGSTRVAEVAARFTLDAMPGKQMAIDADLNAGLISDKEAKDRREAIASEANFYGAMDGSSKFVKGDAVAGIIITLVNIIGGLLIGVFQHDMTFGESAETFTILTIGDGLVSQIPALLISTATGIIITRATKEEKSFAEGTVEQVLSQYKTLLITGFILVIFALVPGLPTLSLFFVGTIFLILGFLIKNIEEGGIISHILEPQQEKKPEVEQEKKPQKTAAELKEEEEKSLAEVLKPEILELEMGYSLIKLIDKAQSGELLERIKSMRLKIAGEMGFLMPQVRIRDNLQLKPNEYVILLKGVEIGKGEIYPDKILAMDSGMVLEEVTGIPTKEPAFGLDAIWVDGDKKEDAIIKGYTVVDPSTVLTTHLVELVKKHADELITRQETQKIMESLKAEYPAVVEDCMKVASLGLIQKIFKALLAEKIPIKDILTIVETITDVAEITKDESIITEQVRSKLARVITKLYTTPDGTLKLMTLAAQSEQKLIEKLHDHGSGTKELVLQISDINTIIETVSAKAAELLGKGISPVVLIVEPQLRHALKETFDKFDLQIVVISHAEVDSSARFEVIDTLELAI